MRGDLPPWLAPPPRAERFRFSSGPVAFTAGVEQFLGRIRTLPSLWLRIALVGVSGFVNNPDNRLRLSGPGCGDWSSVGGLGIPSIPFEVPIYLVLPHDSEVEVYFTRAGSTTEYIRLLGWHFDPTLR